MTLNFENLRKIINKENNNPTRPLKQACEEGNNGENAQWLFGQGRHENRLTDVLECGSFWHVHFKW